MNDVPISPNSIDLFYDGVAVLCALMAIFNAFRYRRRGPSAYVLSAAFLAFGFMAYEIKLGASQLTLGVLGFVTFCLLVADFALRSAKRTEEKGR